MTNKFKIGDIVKDQLYPSEGKGIIIDVRNNSARSLLKVYRVYWFKAKYKWWYHEDLLDDK